MSDRCGPADDESVRDQSPRRWPDTAAPSMSMSDPEHVAAEHDTASSHEVSATRATE
jgi:hypothetical protein